MCGILAIVALRQTGAGHELAADSALKASTAAAPFKDTMQSLHSFWCEQLLYQSSWCLIRTVLPCAQGTLPFLKARGPDYLNSIQAISLLPDSLAAVFSWSMLAVHGLSNSKLRPLCGSFITGTGCTRLTWALTPPSR